MQITVHSYEHHPSLAEGEFIHRFYLSEELRSQISSHDIAVYLSIADKYPIGPDGGDSLEIEYRKEGLIRRIGYGLLRQLYHPLDSYVSEYLDRNLSPEQHLTLMLLNERLASLENELFDKINRQRNILASETAESLLHDFELENSVEFYLSEDSPEYREDEDNLLYVASLCDFQPRQFDWNSRIKGETETPDIHNKPHCRLFHALMEHSPLPLKYVLKIGVIWTDIISVRQNVERVSHCF